MEKKKYADHLKKQVEANLKSKKHKTWVRHIEDTYKECDKSVGFAQKNMYIEDRIEMTEKYFVQLNDINGKNKDINKIKKDLFKFQRLLKQKQREKQNNSDPLHFIAHG